MKQKAFEFAISTHPRQRFKPQQPSQSSTISGATSTSCPHPAPLAPLVLSAAVAEGDREPYGSLPGSPVTRPAKVHSIRFPKNGTK